MDDTQAYWFTCFDASDEVSPGGYEPDAVRAEALSLVSGWSGGIEACIEATPEREIIRSRIRDRWVGPHTAPGKGLVTALGDALHPSTPNLGQGGALALEGAVRLGDE